MKNILVNFWFPHQERQILDFRIYKYDHFEVIDILHKPFLQDFSKISFLS